MTLQRQMMFWLAALAASILVLWLLSPILLPFIGLLTVQDMSHKLILETRWPLYFEMIGAIFVFVPSMGNFVVPELLGGGKSEMVGNLIRDQFLKARDWPFGAVMALTVVALMLVLLTFFAIGERALEEILIGQHAECSGSAIFVRFRDLDGAEITSENALARRSFFHLGDD